MEAHNARLGFILFVIYSVIYAGFVLLNAFAPEIMETKPVAGLNLAILYGFSLIVFALVLSLVYGVMCKTETEGSETADSEGQK
jgi:uncharacterized membrane protein (DUF485 family)